MKKTVKILIGVVMAAVAVSMFVSVAQAGTPHTSYGYVTGGSTSVPWKLYVVARPTETLTGNLVGAGPYAYQALVGNLASPWSVGEDSVAIAWKEDNSGAINHKGYYAVMNEALMSTTPQRYADATLREIPTPTAAANAGTGRVDISWTAATQDQYDSTPTASGGVGNAAGANIAGYNVYRSTNGIAFTKANTTVVSGTSFSDTGGVDGTTYYYAIEIVYKAGVVAGSGTAILSANSNTAVDPVTPVTPTVTGISPSSGYQGTTPTVVITGANTSWSGTMTSSVLVSGSNVTVTSATATDATHISAVLNISASAATGARTVTVTGASGSATFTVVVTPTGPALISATPSSGNQGATLATVDIVGSNTNFTSASSVSFGSGITVGSVTRTDATHITANSVVISSTATTGLRTVSVITGTETATGDVFTVSTSSTGDTTVVIDDYEGSCVDTASGGYYYPFGPTSAANPNYTLVSGAGNFHEGTYGMNTTYSLISTITDAWRGWGGHLTSAKNLSSTANLTFWMKGDGTTNKVKVQFKDADGTNYALNDAYAISTNSAVWHEVTITDFKTKMTRVVSDPLTGDSTMDWSNVTDYQFVFVGTSASTGVLVDYVVATGSTSTTPTIVSISPATGPAGTAVTLVGSNFGSAGDIRFARSGTGTYSIRSTDSNVTSYTSGQIVFTTPALSTGIWNVTVYVSPAESNSVTFEVTAGAPGATDPYNYPNPFNPYRNEITTIVFYPGTSTSATIYLFDSTAKVVQKISWTGTANAAGQASVTWDGKNAYGETVGDGVYLYRVVDGSKALGKGKILAVNK